MLKITYIAHSAFILDDGKYKVALDPFITGNPNATIKLEDVKPDFIFVSHGHGDHIGDTIELAKANDSTVITIADLAYYLNKKGIKTHDMNIGGEYEFPFGTLKMTMAQHSAGSLEGESMGNPTGAIISMGGRKVYFAGDTGLFVDMKFIGEISKPDILMLPIGGNYTMGIDDAVKAVELINTADTVIPMHYNTFPVIKTDVEKFKNKIADIGKKAIVLGYGETINL